MTLSLLDPPPDDEPNDDDDGRLAVQKGFPAPPDRAVYHGLAGQIIDQVAPHTEADRATRGRTLRVNTQDRRID